MSSTNAFTVSQQSVSYHVAKAGLIHLTRCLADELGPKGVRVNALCPGLVDQEDMELALTNDPRTQKIVETIVPLQRACSPIEIAAMVAFLCSPASAYINGQAITMDGGMSAVDQFRVATDILDVHS